MAIGSRGAYRCAVDDDYHFAADLVQIRLVRKELDGYRPITVTFEEGEWMDGVTAENPPAFTMPRELCELLMSVFASYLIGAPDGDLVRTVYDLRQQLSRVTNQLENLIAGIGRLGGSNNEHGGLSRPTRV